MSARAFKLTMAFAILLAMRMPARAEDGATIFADNCALCHQPDGAGAIGLAPALAGTLKRFTTTPAGATYLSQILVSGMLGSIDTQGHKFSGLMPSFADRLSDAQMQAVLGYVLAQFNGVTTPIVTQAAIKASRARAPSASDTHAARALALK